jgi:chitin deacetylase
VIKRKSFVRQRQIFIALVVAVCIFVIGLNLAVRPPVKPPILVQPSVPKKSARSAPEVNTYFVPKEFQGKTIAQTTLGLQEKVIALTFDDGPWPRTTEQVLDILKKNDVKATFFWIGNNVKSFPNIAKLVVEGGHAIGNHTWHHWYRRMNPSAAAREIQETAEIIYKTTGVRTSLFRPPGGILNNGPANYAKKHNYAVMMWSADSRDWFYRLASVQVLVNTVLREAHPGGIVLMHDGGGNRSKTVKALPAIIAELKKRGYKFVTVPELLDLKDKQLKLAMPSGIRGGTAQKLQVKQPQKQSGV